MDSKKRTVSIGSSRRMVCLVLAATALPFAPCFMIGPGLADDFAAVAEILDSRCMSCHDSDTREGGIDLTPLLQKKNGSYGKFTRLWVKLEGVVAQSEMPPEGEDPLSGEEKDVVERWFKASFILRDGKSHIGATPLRRLTKYELTNTLQDLLAIKLERRLLVGSKFENLIPSDLPGESGFSNDSVRLASLKPPIQGIADAVGNALESFSQNAVAQKAVLGQLDLQGKVKEAEIKKVISRFLSRAYRSEKNGQHVAANAFFKRYQEHVKGSKSVLKSLLYVFEMILISPEFLYRFEASKDLGVPYEITGVELATRLSYFLWSTAPDEELLKLGRSGKLLEDAVLKTQITRMLNSPKRISLSENFAAQWLGFDELLSNKEFLVNDSWNRESYDEVLFFFDELIKTEKSLLELVQSDWIYKRASSLKSKRQKYVRIDPRSVKKVYKEILLARMEGTKGGSANFIAPVLVKTRDQREGGIITSAAIMRLTAAKHRTSPIRRGVWVLSTLVGKQLEPPPNVPSLEESRTSLNLKENPSVAQLIKQHVAKPECIGCHQAIDPLGLGLENYSPIGQWRTRYPDKAPIESAGVMPNGKPFETPRELKLLLLEMYKDEIAENFVRQMFAYALGRKLEPFDRVSLDRMLPIVKESGYTIRSVIEQIVLSKQFRCRQDR